VPNWRRRAAVRNDIAVLRAGTGVAAPPAMDLTPIEPDIPPRPSPFMIVALIVLAVVALVAVASFLGPYDIDRY
jgi:hypothetical protein